LFGLAPYKILLKEEKNIKYYLGVLKMELTEATIFLIRDNKRKKWIRDMPSFCSTKNWKMSRE
tara:strand:- start:120 stop:308 length:189 start_codon:yes stop_codon:yes gene_type:complete